MAYSVRFQPGLNLLDITWAGLFTAEEMNRYVEDCRDCWRRERFSAGYRLRIVLSDDKPLPQDALTVLSNAFADYPAAGKIAMVTRSAIARIQINRTMMVSHMKIFDTPEQALEWLLAG